MIEEVLIVVGDLRFVFGFAFSFVFFYVYVSELFIFSRDIFIGRCFIATTHFR